MLCYRKRHFYTVLEMEWGNKMQSSISHLVIEPLYGTWKLNSRNGKSFVYSSKEISLENRLD